jgi:hypothetical protein
VPEKRHYSYAVDFRRVPRGGVTKRVRIRYDFTWNAILAFHRFPCRFTVKIGGIFFDSKTVNAAFCLSLLVAHEIKRDEEVEVTAWNLHEGKKWNRAQVVLSGFSF